jgi:translation initiation factor 2B subunit (eIF-2B alpha/beta/delta family)
MWKPFDLRFEKILSKIDFHEEIVVQELQFKGLEQLQHTSQEEIEKAQQEIEKAQQEIEKADNERLQMLNARDELNEISRSK